MLLVALVFGELASHYPIAGALYQYSKYNVGRSYGWFVGWFYGIALLVTVASVDTGVVGYFAALMHNWFNWNFNPASHLTILIVTLVLLRDPVHPEHHRRQGHGPGRPVRRLRRDPRHHRPRDRARHPRVPPRRRATCSPPRARSTSSTNPLGLNFSGSEFGALMIAVLAPVYIFYGFESAGDISEETKDAGRQVPRAMRHALIWGGVASFIIIAALLLSIPTKGGVAAATSTGGGVPYILAQLPSGLQDFALLLLIFAFFSCGSSVQGAGSRLMFSYARDGALPAAKWISQGPPEVQDPGQRAAGGRGDHRAVRAARVRLPSHNVNILWFTYPANTNVLISLISFGTSGIYLSFLLTVIGAGDRAGARLDAGGQVPARPLGLAGDHPGRACTCW